MSARLVEYVGATGKKSAWLVWVSSWLGESGEAAGTPFGGTTSLITTKLSAVSLLGVFVLDV